MAIITLQNLLIIFSLVAGILIASETNFERIIIVTANAGCSLFVDVFLYGVTANALRDRFNSVEGLTLFTPADDAFKVGGLPGTSDVENLTADALQRLVEYHAAGVYISPEELKTQSTITTLAKGNEGRFDVLTVKTITPRITLESTGNNIAKQSQVIETILDAKPLAIYKVDQLLLPPDIIIGTTPPPEEAPHIQPPPPEAHNVAVHVTTSALFTFVVAVVLSLFME